MGRPRAGVGRMIRRRVAAAIFIGAFVVAFSAAIGLGTQPVRAARCADENPTFATKVCGGAISPGTGTTATTFTFSVIYINTNTNPNLMGYAWVRVSISGIGTFDMTPTGSNYAEGVKFVYARKLPAGTYTYYYVGRRPSDPAPLRCDPESTNCGSPTNFYNLTVSPAPTPTPKPTPKPTPTPTPTQTAAPTPRPTAHGDRPSEAKREPRNAYADADRIPRSGRIRRADRVRPGDASTGRWWDRRRGRRSPWRRSHRAAPCRNRRAGWGVRRLVARRISSQTPCPGSGGRRRVGRGAAGASRSGEHAALAAAVGPRGAIRTRRHRHRATSAGVRERARLGCRSTPDAVRSRAALRLDRPGTAACPRPAQGPRRGRGSRSEWPLAAGPDAGWHRGLGARVPCEWAAE